MTDRRAWCAECGGWGEWIGYKAEIGMQGYVCCPECKGEGLITMTERTRNAIAVADRLPAPGHPCGARNYVLGWAADPDVAIDDMPVLVWRADGVWWAGLPGTYMNLELLEWTITHWAPIDGITHGESGDTK